MTVSFSLKREHGVIPYNELYCLTVGEHSVLPLFNKTNIPINQNLKLKIINESNVQITPCKALKMKYFLKEMSVSSQSAIT